MATQVEQNHGLTIQSNEDSVAGPEIVDPVGIVGMLTGIAILGCLMLGIMIPVVFWVMSGVLGVFTLGCGVLSRSNLRWWCLLLGAMGLIPTILFILVQAIPTMEI